MSYQILYAAKVITVEEKFILLRQYGDNNCYNRHTGQRARDWGVARYLCESFPFTTLAFVEKALQNESDQAARQNAEWREKYPNWGTYHEDQFGYYAGFAIDPLETSQTSLRMVKNYYATAFTAAKPIEETRGVEIFAGHEIWTACQQQKRKTPETENLHSTPDLTDAIARWTSDWGNKFILRPLP